MLYIMRHGRTDWNDLKKLQGGTDIPLNEEGRRMAVEAGKLHQDINFDVCYSSPLCRARETAELFLSGRQVPIICDDRIREMSFGIYEGTQNQSEVKGSPIDFFFNDPTNYVPAEGGESFDELYGRTGEFLREVVFPQIDKGKDILIVGHGAMNLSIINQIREIPLERFWEVGIVNCKLIKLI